MVHQNIKYMLQKLKSHVQPKSHMVYQSPHKTSI
jgi:hypothetical protein